MYKKPAAARGGAAACADPGFPLGDGAAARKYGS